MRAKHAFELIVRRGRDLDQIEIVDIASGETVLLWDSHASVTGRTTRQIKADLVDLEEHDFLARWRMYQDGSET